MILVPIRPTSGVCTIADTAQGEKRLFNWQNQAILTSDGRPLRECRLQPAASSISLGQQDAIASNEKLAQSKKTFKEKYTLCSGM